MPFLRLSRDQRGYENTFLLHAAFPGARPRVLYWYRTAPGVRVGRLALDEDAIRVIEEQHPEIEFDWPSILEEANTLPAEAERRPERPRRKPQRPREEFPSRPAAVAPPSATDAAVKSAQRPVAELPPLAESTSPLESESRPAPQIRPESLMRAESAPSSPPRPVASPIARNTLLDDLVGREIAARLRSRFEEMQTRIDQQPEQHLARAEWQRRVDALNPDSWTTPDAILKGVQHADRLFDELRRDISVTE